MRTSSSINDPALDTVRRSLTVLRYLARTPARGWILLARGFLGAKLRNQLFQFGQSALHFVHFLVFGLRRIRCLGALRDMVGPGSVRHTRGFTVLLRLRRIKSEGIYGWGDQAEKVLVKIKDFLHILSGTFLTGSPRGDHHLAQNIEREVGIRCLGVFYDDLRQYQTRDVFAGRGIDNLYVLVTLQHLGYLVEVYIPAVGCIVEAPVFIFLDEDDLRGHIYF